MLAANPELQGLSPMEARSKLWLPEVLLQGLNLEPSTHTHRLRRGYRLKAFPLMSWQVFDRTVSALTSVGLLVILNNHVSSAGWPNPQFDVFSNRSTDSKKAPCSKVLQRKWWWRIVAHREVPPKMSFWSPKNCQKDANWFSSPGILSRIGCVA